MTLVIVFNQLWNILNLLSEQNKINIPNTYKLVIYFAYFFSMKCFMVSSDLWEPVIVLYFLREPVLTWQSLSLTSYGNQSWHDSDCPGLPMGTSFDITVIVPDFLLTGWYKFQVYIIILFFILLFTSFIFIFIPLLINLGAVLQSLLVHLFITVFVRFFGFY